MVRPLFPLCLLSMALVVPVLADNADALTADGAATVSHSRLESGPKPGDRVASFFVRAVTGTESNRSVCYVCRNGDRPVVMVLMRRLGPNLTELLQGIDGVVDKHRAEGLRSFAVLIDDEPSERCPDLQTLAFDAKLRIPLTVATDAVAAPGCQNIAADAAVTVVLYRNQRVVQSFGFRPNELQPEAIAGVLDAARSLAAAKDSSLVR